jgi:general stress protein YciG
MSAAITGVAGPAEDPGPRTNTEIQGSPSESDEQDATSLDLLPDRPPQRAPEGEIRPKRPRGFAAMDRRLVSEIARKGGRAAHSAGTAHEFTSDEARTAGQKGGRAAHAKRGGHPAARREPAEERAKPQE